LGRKVGEKKTYPVQATHGKRTAKRKFIPIFEKNTTQRSSWVSGARRGRKSAESPEGQ